MAEAKRQSIILTAQCALLFGAGNELGLPTAHFARENDGIDEEVKRQKAEDQDLPSQVELKETNKSHRPRMRHSMLRAFDRWDSS